MPQQSPEAAGDTSAMPELDARSASPDVFRWSIPGLLADIKHSVTAGGLEAGPDVRLQTTDGSRSASREYSVAGSEEGGVTGRAASAPSESPCTALTDSLQPQGRRSALLESTKSGQVFLSGDVSAALLEAAPQAAGGKLPRLLKSKAPGRGRRKAGKELHRGPGFQAVIPDQVGTPSPQIKAWRGEPQRVSFEEAKTLAHASELTAAEALPADAIWEFDEPDTRGKPLDTGKRLRRKPQWMASAVAGPGSAQLPTTGAAATQESDGQTEKPGQKRGREGEAGAPLPQQGPKRIRVVNGFANGAGPKANGASASLPQVLSWKALSNADDLQITIMHKGRTFMGTVHFAPEVAAQMPAMPLNLHQAKPAGAAGAPHKVADQKPHAQPQRQHLRQQRQAPPAHPLLAQAAREAVTPPPAVVAARGKQVPASLAQEDKNLAAQRLEALGPTSGSSANESGSEARRAQAEREFLRMEREGPPAGTKCTLCHRDALEAAREPQFEGRLRQGLGCLVCVRVTATQNTWVHEQCAFWSPEVYEQDYQFMDLGVAVRRGRLIKCKVCNSKGATLGCHVATCKNSAHLPCARFKKWLMDPDSGVVTCSTHQPGIARSSRALRRTGSSQQADEEHTPPAEETGDNVARSGSGRGQSWSGGATAVGTHQGEQAGPPPVVLGRTQAVSAAPSGGQARASEQAQDGVAADRDTSPDQDWKITMTPTLDTKLVNMPPHNFDPAEVPDADMCEFLGGSMGTPGTRRGSPGICRICIVTRQGKCGAPSASRRCLRRQLSERYHHLLGHAFPQQ